MDSTIHALATGHHHLVARAGGSNPDTASKPPSHKIIGIVLAITAGLFIGTSFVIKKVGLLKANVKYNEEAGEGYGYLKNAWWWLGMTLMIVGEICNFAAYAFVDAILVTTLGALSVVIAAILSAIFLKERLSFVGKVGCFMCIVGSVVIVMNAPKQSSAATIQQFKKFMIAPGFLTYAGIVIVGCAFVALWVAPRYGKKSMMVYLTICSLIGGLSVVATQGLGAAIVTQAGGTPQFNQWFLYVLLVFVIATLVTEIIYLNVGFIVPNDHSPPTDNITESVKYLQCSNGHPHLLRVLHQRHHCDVSHLISWIQRHAQFHYHGGHGFPADLQRGGTVAILQVRQRRT